MHNLVQIVTPVAVFIKYCSESLTEFITSLLEAREWVADLFESIALLTISYLIFWPYVVVGVSEWGLFHPLSILIVFQLIPPTIWAGFKIGDILKERF